jgi:hypothetical protein
VRLIAVVSSEGRLPGADWVTGHNGSLYVSQETNVVTRVDCLAPLAEQLA